MIVLDANVLIAYLDRRDPHHEAVLDLLADAADDHLQASAVTVTESLVHPSRQGTAEASLNSLDEIGVGIVPFGIEATLATAHIRASTGLKLPDAIVLHVAEAGRGRLATFDEQLAQTARRAGIEVVGVVA